MPRDILVRDLLSPGTWGVVNECFLPDVSKQAAVSSLKIEMSIFVRQTIVLLHLPETSDGNHAVTQLRVSENVDYDCTAAKA